MAECPPLSVPSVKATLKKASESGEECTKNLCDKKHLLMMAREEAVQAVYRHQQMVVRLNQEIDNVCEDLVNVHVHYLKERETVLHKFLGSLLREKKEKEGAILVTLPPKMPDVPQYVVPKYTPTVKCFLRHDVKNGSSCCGLFASECKEFMLLSNADRLKVFLHQRRCFGCFLPVAVAGHARLRDCKHHRYCTVC